jgi:NAD(P)-dependent dehydrogenase (short-subunit alcohol dehydrogenase family)
LTSRKAKSSVPTDQSTEGGGASLARRGDMSIQLPDSFPASSSVAGRRVVLTGASGGLGRILASAFSRAGARVALIGRKLDGLEDLARSLPGESLICQADVSDAADNDRVAESVAGAWGGIDTWIANAGISPVLQPVLDMAPETWSQVQRVNLDGVFHGARAAAGQMIGAGRGGRIVVTTSVLAERPRHGLSAYSVSKAGATALVKTLAMELGSHGITVNAVAPGWFDSPLASYWTRNPGRSKEITDHTAVGRWGLSQDLPGVYLFLASDASAFVTGSVLTVDGGYLCL